MNGTVEISTKYIINIPREIKKKKSCAHETRTGGCLKRKNILATKYKS